MNRIILYLLVFLLFIQCKEGEPNQIRIRGNVKNSNGEYITLTIEPRYRGALNFDGFKSVGCRIDEKGEFQISADNITEGSNYSLWCNNNHINLVVLFSGDDLDLNFDVNSIDSIFFRGKGAGKNNVLSLEQFQPNYADLSMIRFKAYLDSLISLQSKILDAIYKQDTCCKEIKSAINRKDIKRIIDETPLTTEEYRFLKKIVLTNQYSLAGYPSYLCGYGLADSIAINFSDPYFDFFHVKDFKEIDIVANLYFSRCISDVLQMEYIKNLQTTKPALTYRDWNFMQYDSVFWVQRNILLKRMVKPHVYDHFCAEELSADLSLGNLDSYEKDKTEFFHSCKNRKYLDRFKDFKSC